MSKTTNINVTFKHTSFIGKWILALFVSALPLTVFAESLTDMIERALDVSVRQSLILAHEYESKEGTLPRNYQYSNRQGKSVGKYRGQNFKNWTCGFFPGTLWYLYQYKHNLPKDNNDKRELKRFAEIYTHRCDSCKTMTNTHDLGFMLYCSYGNAYRLTGEPHYLEVLKTGASSLATRYNEKLGVIQSWGSNSRWKYPVIIDNMLNLELLYEMGYKDMAVSHAAKTLQNHFRDDNSCYHVVSYDPATGKPHAKCTHQGLADSSAWARGQAWALYGFTMMYRESKKAEFLQQAKKVAEFIMNHPNMPKDKIPYWDFDAQGEERDASSAACIASALIELSELDTDIKGSQKYLDYATDILRNLSSPKYLAEIGENGGFILMHSVGNKKKNSEVDAALTYADYYYVEALLRLRNAIEGRKMWVRKLHRVAYPVMYNLSQETLKKNMPFGKDDKNKDRKAVSYLEAVGRTLYGIAPWMELGADNTAEGILRGEYIKMTLKGLDNAFNPKSSDHLLFGEAPISQALVDAAYLAQGLLMSKTQIWKQLNTKTKKKIIDELKSTRRFKPSEKNWLLFASMIECAIQEFTGECDTTRLFYGAKRFLTAGWYKGDGWYGDGMEFHFDYYNSLVISPMLTQTLYTIKTHFPSSIYASMVEKQEKRESRLAEQLERLISPEGTYPCVGRSITYRGGIFNALCHASLYGLLPSKLSGNQVRSALSAVLRNQLEADGTFDHDGWLNIGFSGAQPKMAEKYINTGSDYLCSAIFLPLGLPETNRFWKGEPEMWTNKKAWKGIDIGTDHALRDLNK